MVTTTVEKSEEEPNRKDQLSYRERVQELAKKAPLFDLDAFKTDLFKSDEELEEFIEDIYRYRRSWTA